MPAPTKPPKTFLAKTLDVLPIQFWVQRLIDAPILLSWASIPKNASILEIGCGSGHLARYMAHTLKARAYTAVNADPLVISQADARSNQETKVIFQVADPAKLPFEAGTFDAVLVVNALHTIPNWKKVIGEIHRVLKKKGRFLLRDFSIETFCIPGLGMVFQKLIEKPYDDMYDQIELLTYIRKNGFDITHQNDASRVIMMAATKKEKE